MEMKYSLPSDSYSIEILGNMFFRIKFNEKADTALFYKVIHDSPYFHNADELIDKIKRLRLLKYMIDNKHVTRTNIIVWTKD